MKQLQKAATVLVAGLGFALVPGLSASAMGGHGGHMGGGAHMGGGHFGGGAHAGGQMGGRPFAGSGYRPNAGAPMMNRGVGSAMAHGYGYGYAGGHPGPAIYHVGGGNRGFSPATGYRSGGFAPRGFGGGRHYGYNRFHRGYGRGIGYGLAGVGLGYGLGDYGAYPDYGDQGYGAAGYGAGGYGSTGYGTGYAAPGYGYAPSYGYGTQGAGYGAGYAAPTFTPVIGGNSVGYDAGYAGHCGCH